VSIDDVYSHVNHDYLGTPHSLLSSLSPLRTHLITPPHTPTHLHPPPPPHTALLENLDANATLDLLFMLDCTGSMSSFMHAAKTQITQVCVRVCVRVRVGGCGGMSVCGYVGIWVRGYMCSWVRGYVSSTALLYHTTLVAPTTYHSNTHPPSSHRTP
jgi:hypothetical protein